MAISPVFNFGSSSAASGLVSGVFTFPQDVANAELQLDSDLNGKPVVITANQDNPLTFSAVWSGSGLLTFYCTNGMPEAGVEISYLIDPS